MTWWQMSQVGDLVVVAKVTESDLVVWSQVGGLGAGGRVTEGDLVPKVTGG